MSSRGSATWLLAGNLLFMVVQFAASIVVARLLSAEEMGVYAIALAATMLLHALQNMGLSSYVVSERELPPEKLGTVVSVCLLQGLLLAGAFWAVAPLLADLVREPRVAHTLRILCLFALILPVRGTLAGLLQRQMRLDRFSLVYMLDTVVAAAVAIAGAYVGLSYTALAWGSVAGIMLSTSLLLFWLRRDLRVPLTLAYWSSVWTFGSAMMVATLVNNICIRSPDIVIGRVVGVTAVGLYNRGAGLVQVLTTPVLASAQRLLQPLLARCRDDPDAVRAAYLRSVTIITGVLWPALAGLAILSMPTIVLLYGEAWAGAQPALALVAVALMIDVVFATRAEVLVNAGQTRLLSRNEVASGLIGLGMLAVSVPFGLVAAAASRIPAAVATALIYARPVARAGAATVPQIIAAAASSLGPTIAAAGPALVVMAALDWPQELDAIDWALTVLGGIACWLAAIFATGHELKAEVVRLAQVLRRRSARAGGATGLPS